MTRTALVLALSALRSLALALIVVGCLVVASKVAQAAPTSCGTPNNQTKTCPNNPPCPSPQLCFYYGVWDQNGNFVTSYCYCT